MLAESIKSGLEQITRKPPVVKDILALRRKMNQSISNVKNFTNKRYFSSNKVHNKNRHASRNASRSRASRSRASRSRASR